MHGKHKQNKHKHKQRNQNSNYCVYLKKGIMDNCAIRVIDRIENTILKKPKTIFRRIPPCDKFYTSLK